MNDDEVRALGFEPTRRGWRPLTEDVDQRMAEADARRRVKRPNPLGPIPGPMQPCVVCGDEAEPSSVDTPTCSFVCTAQLADEVLPLIADRVRGGTAATVPEPAQPSHRHFEKLLVAPTASRRPSRWPRGGTVETARERLGDVVAVLSRHGARVRGRSVFCPLHENSRTPAASIYERRGRLRFHCHACGFDGDAIDLEAALSGRDVFSVISEFGR